MADLHFEISWLYADSPNGISLPVNLRSGEHATYTLAKVDTGAEFCVFSREVGLELGLDLESGLPKRMSSLTGSLDTYGHEVTIQTFEIAFQSYVYFAKHPGLERNLLGRIGWLRNLRLAIVDYDNLLHISRY
jgi:hypothetical protein